jgi:uncharacterized membrane protein YdjX (TVP38/TMEM64 family)
MTDATPTDAHPLLRRLPLITVMIAAVFGALFLRDVISFDTLRDNRATLLEFRDANYGMAVAAFVLVYAAIVALSLPGATMATLTGGFLFATFPGAVFNVTGATIGAIGIFLAARAGLGERLASRIDEGGGMVKRVKEGIDDNQWSMLFLIRLVPAVPFFAANLIPALVGVPLLRFAVSTFLGIMPGTFVYTSVGAGLSEVFERGETPDLSIIFTPPILLPLLGLAALALLPVVIKVLRGRGL